MAHAQISLPDPQEHVAQGKAARKASTIRPGEYRVPRGSARSGRHPHGAIGIAGSGTCPDQVRPDVSIAIHLLSRRCGNHGG